MATPHVAAYRSILRQMYKSSIVPRQTRNKELTANIRALLEDRQAKPGTKAYDVLLRDIEDASLFLRSQRMYTELLDRYNPTHVLTQEERVQATARRVGLDMPVEKKSSE